ncbi:hypothetical protein K3165_06940 [Qipengyuania sp. 1XM1-15A]|uniref:hypothetical protein n=1 Tax=Qipengyuania xiamenensis TaxID=2867237 RepID=UPI001C879183|nr:hypothetical protein [Qipengyuania xiamenensis]MBX7532652.1 hypothetical protein [Qipengyuania xiamenensis]
MIHRLDLDVAIYRDRVQVTHRGSGTFVDMRAEFAFSSDARLVEHARYFEDTLVRAMRQVLAEGGFSLKEPIAHVVRFDGDLDETQKALIETGLRETGFHEVIFELDA